MCETWRPRIGEQTHSRQLGLPICLTDWLPAWLPACLLLAGWPLRAISSTPQALVAQDISSAQPRARCLSLPPLGSARLFLV
jgi:hypothetical protein